MCPHFELEVLRIKNTLRVDCSLHFRSIAISSNRYPVREIGAVWKRDHHTAIMHLHTLGSDYDTVPRQIDEQRLIGNTGSEHGVDWFTGPINRLISFHLKLRIVGERNMLVFGSSASACIDSRNEESNIAELFQLARQTYMAGFRETITIRSQCRD